MRSLADKFRETLLNNYDQAQRDIGLEAPDFLHALDVHGALDAARQTVRGLGAGVDVRRALRQGKRLELSVEASMLRPEFAPLFTQAELAAARDALFQYGYRAPWDTSAHAARTPARTQLGGEPVAAEIPPVPRSALVMALEVFDREQRKAPEWRDWEGRSTLRKALRHDGRLYPIKEILRMATGAGEDTRDEDAVDYVRKRGFDIVPMAQRGPAPEPPEREPPLPAPEPEPPAESVTVREERPAEPTVPVTATSAAAIEPQAALPDAERQDLVAALEIFDDDERLLPEWLDWESSSAEAAALVYEGRRYPAVEIIRLATGTQEPLSAEQVEDYLRRHGFDIAGPRAAAAPPAPTVEPVAAPRTPRIARDIAATVKAYAALAQSDLREHIDWLRGGLGLDELLDESALLDAASRETLALARLLWADLEDRRAADFGAPALLLVDVLERAASEALRDTAQLPRALDGTLEGLVAHRAAAESALAGCGWQAHGARGQQYTPAQWLDALPIVTAIRARAAAGEPLSPAAFQELLDVLCGSPLCGPGALNGLLSACSARNSKAER